MFRTLIIFDVDGTLTDSAAVDADCYIAALYEALGLRLESADWSRFVDCTDAGIAAEFFQQTYGKPIEESALTTFATCFFSRLQSALAMQACAAIEGAAVLLERLRRTPELAACLATGAWERSARLKLEAARLDVADLAFASCNDAHNRRDIVRAAITRAQQREGPDAFDACVAVGDGVWDLLTAAELGIPFIGIGSGQNAERLRDAGAELVLESYRDADAFISAVRSCALRAHGSSGGASSQPGQRKP